MGRKIETTEVLRQCRSLLIFLLTASAVYSQQPRDTSLILYFNSGEYKLDATQAQNIINFANSVTGFKDVIGYADTVGTVVYNQNLSRMRALSVYNIIAKHSRPERLYSFKGEQFPQDSALWLNRKVEVTAYIIQNRHSDTALLDEQLIDSFNIETINFVPDQAILTPESLGEIPHLVQKIKAYRASHFDIIGHVNYQSKSDRSALQDLYKLSEQRAKVIFDILVENGIPNSVLKYIGVGNSRPLILNPKNDEERMKNMRVQILVFASVSK